MNDTMRAYRNETGYAPATETEALTLLQLRCGAALPLAAKYHGYGAAQRAHAAYCRAFVAGRGHAVATRYARRTLKAKGDQ